MTEELGEGWCGWSRESEEKSRGKRDQRDPKDDVEMDETNINTRERAGLTKGTQEGPGKDGPVELRPGREAI